jgi:hypothetical protein
MVQPLIDSVAETGNSRLLFRGVSQRYEALGRCGSGPRSSQWLNQEYAELSNERHRRVGHLVQDRFKGILVELLELICYIVLNPVRCHAVTFAGDYEWSNYRATAGFQAAPPWLDIGWTLDHFGPTARPRMKRTGALSPTRAAPRTTPGSPSSARCTSGEPPSATACNRMQSLVAAKPRSRELPRDQRRFVRPTLDAIVVLVTDRFEVTPDELKRKSRGQARKALAHLAVDDAGLTLRGIADWKVTEWAASKMRQTARNLYAADAGFRDRVDQNRTALS